MVGTWKLRETTASAAAANWRDAHLQMFKGTGKGVNRGPKTKHIMTKIMLLNMNVKSLIGVMSFRYSFPFHIGSLMRSARMFVCLPEKTAGGGEGFVTENCDFHTPPEVVHDSSNERESFVLSRNNPKS